MSKLKLNNTSLASGVKGVTLSPLLVKFLRNQKVLTRFKFNLKRKWKGKTPSHLNLNLISESFIWSESVEGHEFWNGINAKKAR